jgi:hypothetical protein
VRAKQSPAERRFSKLAAAINQKSRRVGAAGRVTAEDLARVYIASGRQCAYCHIGVDWRGVSFDHVVPFTKGGQNFLDNLEVACLTCQRGKFTKTPEEWAAAQVLTVQCEVCKREFKPRWSDWVRGYGRICSRICSGTKGGMAETAVAI